MKMNYKIVITYLFALTISSSIAQKVEFNSTIYPAVKKLKTVNVSQLDDKYLPHLQSLEAPEVSGESYKAFLASQKEKISKIYPPSYLPIAKKRSVVSPPVKIEGFAIFGVQQGIPCDNHLAMNGDDIVSAGNSYMAVHDPSGGLVKKFTLNQFAEEAGITANAFDPRLAYDIQTDRYFFTCLAGFNSSDTHIVVGYSASEDPTGDWNIYSIVGNPNGLNQWTDYPMISITNDHVFLTINLLRDNETWQAGFEETIIWQMDKNSGYEGTDLGLTRIDGITFGGQNIRNLCPAESATEEFYDDIYFISNRNFAVEADSFFMVKLDPNAATPDEQLEIQFIQSDVPYGAPPNAKQRVGYLQTNDARVLEAFRLGDEIQFVGNTRNLDNNLAGIYHGIIENINDPQMVKLNHIIGSDTELGYPGIIYTGETSSDRDAIIAFNHTSGSGLPGVSALYSIPEEGYSEIVQMGQGNNHVDQLTGDLERWGDYLGTQRNYADPRDVWVSGFVGIGAASNAPYICHIRRPEIPLNTEGPKIIEEQTIVYPNPVEYRSSIEINIPENTKSIKIDLLSINGELLDMIYSSDYVKKGKNSFSFNTERLAKGSYIIKVMLDKIDFVSKTIVKM